VDDEEAIAVRAEAEEGRVTEGQDAGPPETEIVGNGEEAEHHDIPGQRPIPRHQNEREQHDGTGENLSLLGQGDEFANPRSESVGRCGHDGRL
jgi:hypothetical protein